MMNDQVRQLIRLIDDLMDVSRITSGKIEVRPERGRSSNDIEGAVESIRPVIDSGACRLTATMPDAPMLVDDDHARLTQVFGSILNNAVKFTEQKGAISVIAKPQCGRAVVTIRDDGPGIPRHMLAEIFEPFQQVDATLERSHGGLGIGLVLVKRLTELRGGTVEARSEGLEKGPSSW